MVCARVRAGVGPVSLAGAVEDALCKHGADPVLRGIGAQHGLPPFPAPMCVSVNDVAVNGVPGCEPLADGDRVTVDVACAVDGWHADHAATIVVTETGSVPDRSTGEVLKRVVASIRIGEPVDNVYQAYLGGCQQVGGYPVAEAVLHGIGRCLHEPPTLFDGAAEPAGVRFETGMLLAVEPVVADRPASLETLGDGWSRRLVGGGLAGYEERTVFLSEQGPIVLTGPGRFRGSG
ncbi:MAG: M24 family metallopeptidase [Planctomycetota bacterium]